MSEEKTNSWRSLLSDTLLSRISTAKALTSTKSDVVHYEKFSKTPIFEEMSKESEGLIY